MPTKTKTSATPASASTSLVGGVHLLLGPDTGKKRTFVERVVAAAEEQFGGGTEVLRTFPLRHRPDRAGRHAAYPGPVHHPLRGAACRRRRTCAPATKLEALIAYCRDPAPASTLLLTANGMQRDLPAALTRAVSSARTTVFWEMFENQRQGWLIGYFREARP